ncbi:MAG TPA: carboxypeptidase-like regulatory domain-containing protein [Pyrinomonadaceae bacterium]|nr:carboxypeptidase-like regulatory domain-containing protein [Pyrinomonadaceae bacterium]
MKSNKLMTCLLFTLFLACAAPAFAQSDRGTITGSVTDPNGGLVAGAKVTATNLSTGEVREATTSEEGTYTMPELAPAPYRLSVEASGFKTSTVENIQVGVQTTRRADFTLELGQISDVVTVTSDSTPTIQTDTPVRQSNVNERQVRELPLLVNSEAGGRTPLAFIFLDSNVSAGSGANAGGGGNATNFRVSGGQGLGTEILVDGASTRRTQNGTFFSEVAPGPNAFQEFTLSTSTYSAEYGNSSGGIINFSLKSGGNEFHGEVYDYIRNENFNANTFINNSQGRDPITGRERLERRRDNQNDFGFNLGGPITLPHFGEGGPMVHRFTNRAFFFFNYEGYRRTTGANALITVPTARMRMGDFGELLTDPYILREFPADPANGRPVAGVQIYNPLQAPTMRQAIPGNRLDQFPALIDPAGLAALQFFPLPNTTGPLGSRVFRNYLSQSIIPLESNQFTVKPDFIISDKQKLTFSYSYRRNTRIAQDGGAPPPRFPLPFTSQGVFEQDFRSHLARLQHDYSFTPTILNHLNLGFTRFDVANANTTAGFNTSSLGLPVNATQNAAFPRLGFPGYGDPATTSDPRGYQDIGSTFFTDRIRDNSVQVSDFVSFRVGRHALKVGGDVRIGQFNIVQRIDPGGSFNFRHDQTSELVLAPTMQDPMRRVQQGGWPIASLITGATEFSFNSTNSIDPAFRQLTQSYFINDDFKVTPRLTLNLGLRYDLPGLRSEARDRFRSFVPDAVNPDPRLRGRRGAIAGAAGQGGVQAQYDTLLRPDRSNIGPRAGFAYSLNDQTVVRGGGGIFYAPVLYGSGGGGDINTGTIGYNTGSGARTPDGIQARFFLRSYPSIPSVDPGGQFVFNDGGQDVQFFDPTFRTGRTVQYSLDLQRQLPYNFAASIGYIGHKATRLRSDFGRLNALPLNALRLGFPLLNKGINQVTATDRTYAASVGVTLPASGDAVFQGFDGTVAQSLRPFPQYRNINNILESQGTSDYNALQLKLDRRFAQGIQFGASYTFSKLITDASEDVLGGGRTGLNNVIQFANDRAAQRTVSPTNPTHVFVVNYLLELPFGKGKRFLNRGGIVDKIVGGFQLSGIQRYQSGLPLTFFTDNGDARGFLDLIGVGGNLRLNLTGQPIAANSRDAIVTRGATPGVVVINPGAFAAPPPFRTTLAIGSQEYANYYANPLRFFGTAPAVFPNVRGDKFSSENISLLKKTRITETTTFEVGAEAFNIFNRTRFFAPTTNFGTFDVNNPSNTIFGFQSFIGDENVYSPRVVQLRVRLVF